MVRRLRYTITERTVELSYLHWLEQLRKRTRKQGRGASGVGAQTTSYSN